MSSKWHVYKLFKNGKRAKAPIYSFEYDGDASSATFYFKSIGIEKLGEKIRGVNFRILNDSESQERDERTKEDETILLKNKVLAKLVKEKKLPPKKKYVGGMIYSARSNWKWQWAVLEAATSNYIEGLSQEFDSHKDAEDWMNQQIADLSTGK